MEAVKKIGREVGIPGPCIAQKSQETDGVLRPEVLGSMEKFRMMQT